MEWLDDVPCRAEAGAIGPRAGAELLPRFLRVGRMDGIDIEIDPKIVCHPCAMIFDCDLDDHSPTLRDG